MPESTEPTIQLVAIDVDDTLLTPELHVSLPVQQAIAQARRQGVAVTLSTGRMFRAAHPFARLLDLDLPLIVYQGAMIKDGATGEILLHRPVDQELALEVLDFLRGEGLHVNLYMDDHLHVERIGPEVLDYMDMARVPATLVRDQRRLLEQACPTKILAIGDPERMAALVEPCRRRWGDRLYVTRSKPYYLEFMNRQSGKGTALAFLAERLGISRESVVAIGDSYNDLDMLAYAGVGVAMGNAPDEVKAHADWVAPSNDADGVAAALRRWVLTAKTDT
ncbi:Cof-type HAD-IIB family hydrolase [Heliobacterium gestii]|uniref:Cof-type HAD-IIB family hydrolase n=1 Tax=Heliomicrobium gestii TaxID=2699 RepID=A0A845LIP5_HELGE|nr:Cof-type HAD-IIB family hydrolase [Heliomicrobium gestii]MBM7868245.1 Cof subfamily protein (haloacid dehalogenase superfamily) [Heliomicrobium gestii]MZP44439.1 Cof-type HAD-IIB family hydrolase [Heliomicrobium gestii]